MHWRSFVLLSTIFALVCCNRNPVEMNIEQADVLANLDAIHENVHEKARDEARHGKAFEGLPERYFK